MSGYHEENLEGFTMKHSAPNKATGEVIVRADGTTTCCDAYTSIFLDDGVEYCKACYRDVVGHENPADSLRTNITLPR